MDMYDEDLSENHFLQLFEQTQPALYDEATSSRWLICVPRTGTLDNSALSEEDYRNHLLIPQDDQPAKFCTSNSKEVQIQGTSIRTGKGFRCEKVVSILFEETYFNKHDESYRVLCVTKPLAGGSEADLEQDSRYAVRPQTLADCIRLLWGDRKAPGQRKRQKLVDDAMVAFLGTLNKLEGESFRHHVDAANTLFTKAMQIVLKDRTLKERCHNKTFMDNVKLAVETYVMHGVHKRLFCNICTCVGSRDAHLNKITRNVYHLQLRDLGVRLEFGQNVPRARREVSHLDLYTTPIGKVTCLKRVVNAILQPPNIRIQQGDPIPLTSDDLLSILIFLVVKIEMPNWWANFLYMTNFRFSKSSNNDEYGFYLASLEAALEHVSSGQLFKVENSNPSSKILTIAHVLNCRSDSLYKLQLSISPGGESPWQRQDSYSSAVESLFQHVKDNNISAVTDLLNRKPSPVVMDTILLKQLCHPLCTCAKCSRLLKVSEEECSQVTVFSRNERGYTVLHLAALYGFIEMTEYLIQQGALVNATDFNGSSPLHLSCQKGHQRLILLLLHYEADINLQDNEGYTGLHLATSHGHEDCVKALVYYNLKESQLNLNLANDFGDTPLHTAAKWGYYNIVDTLVENGACTDARNRRNQAPRDFAHNVNVTKRLGQPDAISLVKQSKRHCINSTLSVKTNEKYGKITETVVNHEVSNPVAGRVTNGDTPEVKTRVSSNIISSGSTDNLPGPSLDRKCNTADSSNVRKIKLSVPDSERQLTSPTPATEKKVEKLLKAVADGDVQMAKFHLDWTSEDCGSDDDDTLDLSSTQLCHPLCQCFKCRPLQKFTISPPSGVHVNSFNADGFSPLHVAAMHGHITLVDLFIRRGGDLNFKNFTQEATPLHLACKRNRSKVVKILIKHGAKVNVKDVAGNTPLHYCCLSGNTATARMLLQTGANVNLPNKKGNTALHDACRWNWHATIRLLAESGGNLYSLNNNQVTPLDLAQSDDVVKLLKDAARKQYITQESAKRFEPRSQKFETCGKTDTIRDIFAELEESSSPEKQRSSGSINNTVAYSIVDEGTYLRPSGKPNHISTPNQESNLGSSRCAVDDITKLEIDRELYSSNVYETSTVEADIDRLLDEECVSTRQTDPLFERSPGDVDLNDCDNIQILIGSTEASGTVNMPQRTQYYCTSPVDGDLPRIEDYFQKVSPVKASNNSDLGSEDSMTESQKDWAGEEQQ